MKYSRIDSVDLLALGTDVAWTREESESPPEPSKALECIVIWRADDETVPDTLIVAEPLSEFFAWTATYLPHLVPISALFRVVRKLPRVHRHVPHPTERALGVLLGELAAMKLGDFDESSITRAELRSSLTFGLIQAGDRSEAELSEVAERWLEARRLMLLRDPKYSREHVLEVWAATRETEAIRNPRAASDLFEYAIRRAGGTLSLPLAMAPNYEKAFANLHEGPLEDRVRVFRLLMNQVVRDTGVERAAVGRLLGEALSKVSSGSFGHAHLLGPDDVPDARSLLWYGWYEVQAASRRGTKWFGERVGLRVMIDILDSSRGNRCPCDIALDELRVLSRDQRQLWSLVGHSDVVRVLIHEDAWVEFATYLLRNEIEPGPRKRRGARQQ